MAKAMLVFGSEN